MKKYYYAALVWICLCSQMAMGQTAKWVWAKQGRMNTAQSYASSSSDNIITDGAGNSYVSGYFSCDTLVLGSFTLRNTGAPFSNLFVAKYDPNGTVLWAQQTTNCYFSYSAAITLDQGSQHVYVTGRIGAFSNSNAKFGTASFLGQYQTMYLAQLDAGNGNVNWLKEAIVGSEQNVNTALGVGLATFGTNSIYVAGNFKSVVTFGGITDTSRGSYDGFLAKYDNNGHVLWVKTAGSLYQQTGGVGVATDADGNVYTTGNFGQKVVIETDSFTGNNCIYTAKYDSMGAYKWSRASGGSNNSYNGVTEMVSDANANIYITGTYLNTNITFGSYTLNNSTGNYKVFLVKYDKTGTAVWAKDAGVNYNSGGGPGLGVDKFNNIYLAGSYGPTPATIGSFTLNATPGSGGTRDVFAAKYDANGTALWAKSAGGASDDYGYDISADDFGNAYVTGFSQSTTMNFDTIALNALVTSEMFTAKLNGGGNAPVADFTYTDTVVCAGTDITFTDASTGSPTAWKWTFGGGSPGSSTSQNPTVTYNTAGTYDVTLVVSNGNGADSITKVGRIKVNAKPAVPALTVSDSIICSGDSSLICAPDSFSAYLWNTSDTSRCIQAKNAGGYWVTVTNVNGCSNVSNHFTLNVYPVPALAIFVQGDTLGSFGGVAYRWRKNGVVIPGATGSSYIATETGDYSVEVTYENGCVTISTTIHIEITVGINETGSDRWISLYPNPAAGKVYITIQGKHEVSELRLSNMLGQQVLQQSVQLPGSRVEIDLAGLPQGVYQLNLYNHAQLLGSKRLVH